MACPLTFLQATGTYKKEASQTSFTIWDQTHAFGVFHEVDMSHFIRGGRSELLVASPSNASFFFLIQLLVYNHVPPKLSGKRGSWKIDFRRKPSGLPKWLSGKEPACQAGDAGSIPDQEDPLEKEKATHSSILAWKIPWTEEPGGLQSKESQRVRHN